MGKKQLRESDDSPLDAGEVVSAAKKQRKDKDPEAIAKCAPSRAEVFEKYGIVIGPYNKLKGKPGYQREHFIPNSCFMAQPGRTGQTVPGAEGYSVGKAITYLVYDNQSAGTEHKYLTDRERDFASKMEQSPEQFATIDQWLDEMENATVESFMKPGDDLSGCDIATKRPLSASEAKLVAKCIRQEYQDSLDKLGIKKDVKLGNSINRGGSRPTTVQGIRNKRRDHL